MASDDDLEAVRAERDALRARVAELEQLKDPDVDWISIMCRHMNVARNEIEQLKADRDHARQQAAYWYLCQQRAVGLTAQQEDHWSRLFATPDVASDGWRVDQLVGEGR